MSARLSLLDAALDPRAAPEPALIAGGEAHSYDSIAARVAAAARRLAERGVGPGARVALRAASRPETFVVLHALSALGAAIVPIHPRLTRAEAEVVLAMARPALALSDDEVDELAAGRADVRESVAALPSCDDPELPFAIVATSGTTGTPKGAVLPRRAFLASADASAANLPLGPGDRWIACMPLGHVGGLSILTRCLLARAAVVLVPRFEPEAVLDAVARGATLLSVVPTMLRALLEADAHGLLAKLRAVLVGGAAAPRALLDACAERRVLALTTYGLTEACSQVTTQRLRAPDVAEPGSGHALPGTEVRIARSDGSACERGEIGRILVRGPTLFHGYLRLGARSLDPARDAEGFFDTGDLGALDARGALHVEGRRADLVVTGGENVYPAEVEAALTALPGVADALVFGVSDERWGQVVAAAIVPAKGFDEARVADAIAERLAPHKRPRRIAIVDATPATAAGKPDRLGAPARLADRLRALAYAKR